MNVKMEHEGKYLTTDPFKISSGRCTVTPDLSSSFHLLDQSPSIRVKEPTLSDLIYLLSYRVERVEK